MGQPTEVGARGEAHGDGLPRRRLAARAPRLARPLGHRQGDRGAASRQRRGERRHALLHPQREAGGGALRADRPRPLGDRERRCCASDACTGCWTCRWTRTARATARATAPPAWRSSGGSRRLSPPRAPGGSVRRPARPSSACAGPSPAPIPCSGSAPGSAAGSTTTGTTGSQPERTP